MNWKTGVIAGVVLLTAILMVGWQLSPRVELNNPSGEPLQGRQALEISFTRAMDPSSVEKGFNLEPAVPGKLTWNETRDRFIFTPGENWPAGTSLTIKIQSGTRSRLWLPTLRNFETVRETSPSLIAYLWPAEGDSNLYLANPLTGDSQPLTAEPAGILDYSVSADGLNILFSVSNLDGTSRIYSIDRNTYQKELLLDCPAALCLSPKLSPDGVYLAYEFIPLNRESPPNIRVINLSSQDQLNPGNESDHLEKPLWSNIGWLVYYNQTQLGYEFWKPNQEENLFLPQETGGDGAWSPDGRYFVSSEIQFTSETLAPRHLLMYDTKEETTLDLTRGRFIEDLNPSFSPQGLTLAYSRKSLDPQNWTPGRQLWIMNVNTGENTPVTDEGDYHHTSFAWHPDGTRLAFVRYNQAALSDPPEIWLIMADGSDRLRLIINGFAPTWIP
jgi:Tol biopolymer transport system component